MMRHLNTESLLNSLSLQNQTQMSPPPPSLPHLTPLSRQVLAAIILHHPFTHPPPPSFPGLTHSTLLPILLSLPSLLFLPPSSLGRQSPLSSPPPCSHSRSLTSLSLQFYSFAHSLALSPPHPLTLRAMARLLALSPLPFSSLLHFLTQNSTLLTLPTLTSLLPLLPPLPSLRLFRLIPRLLHSPPDTQSFNTVISSLCRSRHFSLALSLLSNNSPQRSRQHYFHPDKFTYTILISAFCHHARQTACTKAVRHRVWQASHLFRQMVESGIEPDVVTYNCLIDGLCKTYRVGRAWEVFEEMGRRGCVPNRVTYNSFVRYYGKVNEVDKGIEVMREMVARGHGVATCSTYTPIVHSLCEVGRVREAKEFVVEMVDKGSTPREFTYRLVRDSLRREGEEDLPLDLRRKIESGIDERYRRVMQVKPMMKGKDHQFVQQEEEEEEEQV